MTSNFDMVSQSSLFSISYVSTSSKQVKTEPVKISLKDCLACSGCVTSAETVMLEKQSLDEFLLNLDKGKAVTVSLSPQSRASLAVYFGISPLQVNLTLVEYCNVFITRYKQRRSSDGERCQSSLPMISSACPGWICYAEKQLGSYVLPYISSRKSPQQTIGVIVNTHVCQKMGLRTADVYHVTVMPCYDKMLEASRDDFVFEVDQSENNENEGLRVTEVDSVLTSGEVLELIQLKGVDFKGLEESPLDNMQELLTNFNEGSLFGVHGSSGGYAKTIFSYAAEVLFGREVKGPIDFISVKNSDFQELTLESIDGLSFRWMGRLLKFALCYGFRNLQSVVRKIKIGKCDYHFLEIMACPSGCLNGGGQIKPQPEQSGKELIQLLQAAYMENVRVGLIVTSWIEKAKRLFHTEYHPIVKCLASQLHNW
ncbi:unnamed protein product [Malus baccata var. baccata]